METKQYIKRIFDLTLSLLSLIILAPFFLIILIGIKVSSRGPVFFKQNRLGLKGKEFQIYKFRTMIVGAENLGDGLIVKSSGDNRITKIGKFLRATSLDELPQLFNVLKGDMSIVGPRPPVTYHPYDGILNYPDWAKKRFEVKPGITGLAQVKVRNSVGWDERIKVDNEYIKNFSLKNDIVIILLTVKKVFKSTDIYN
ncbi:sugar transferase [Aerococcaceae bacterium WS4759]|uniref:Sugar transferase n=1 Tax=Fundicoccus ignavus TaxID=2664442 RepID=A0A6I2GH89_9LACT|nr:sugar transferase [Fundicoccus ignavus]MRI84619.1 sugar transferase [Fundicoccus ignavus]